MITVEQVVNAQKTHAANLFGLTGKALEGVEKLIELNLSTAKAALGEAAQTTRLALSAKEPHELVTLQASLLQPAAENAAAYGRNMYDIAASTGAEVTRVAEAQSAEAQAKLLAIVDMAVKNAPAGTENGVALVKSALAAATHAIETAQKAARHAAEVAETNFKAMSSTAVRAAKKAKRG